MNDILLSALIGAGTSLTLGGLYILVFILKKKMAYKKLQREYEMDDRLEMIQNSFGKAVKRNDKALEQLIDNKKV